MRRGQLRTLELTRKRQEHVAARIAIAANRLAAAPLGATAENGQTRVNAPRHSLDLRRMLVGVRALPVVVSYALIIALVRIIDCGIVDELIELQLRSNISSADSGMSSRGGASHCQFTCGPSSSL